MPTKLPTHPTAEAEELPAAGRELLTPGPAPPLSHFGLTLLRHGVATGLRFASYHLGLPVPEAPPVKILNLRLYLERDGLLELWGDAPGGAEMAACLLDPGGAGWLGAGSGPAAGRLRAGLLLHRMRLLFTGKPRPLGTMPQARAAARTVGGAEPEKLWRAFRDELTRLAPSVGDAFLAEMIGARERRRARAAGRAPGPCLSAPARRVWEGHPVPGQLFGPMDPYLPSWAGFPEAEREAREALARSLPTGAAVPEASPFRGRFRHHWRAMLDRLDPLYRALGESAHRRGYLEEPTDAYFLPFDVAGDLAAPERPKWLPEGAAKNRREYHDAHRFPEPLPRQSGRGVERADEVGPRPEWAWSELLPMP